MTSPRGGQRRPLQPQRPQPGRPAAQPATRAATPQAQPRPQGRGVGYGEAELARGVRPAPRPAAPASRMAEAEDTQITRIMHRPQAAAPARSRVVVQDVRPGDPDYEGDQGYDVIRGEDLEAEEIGEAGDDAPAGAEDYGDDWGAAYDAETTRYPTDAEEADARLAAYTGQPAPARRAEVSAAMYKRGHRVELSMGYVWVRPLSLFSMIQAAEAGEEVYGEGGYALPNALIGPAKRLLYGTSAEAPAPATSRPDRLQGHQKRQPSRAEAADQAGRVQSENDRIMSNMIPIYNYLCSILCMSFRIANKPPHLCAEDEVSVYDMDEADKIAIATPCLGGQQQLARFR